jgi:hypothetical protein
VLVAYACSPSYSGGLWLKASLDKYFSDSLPQKNPSQKRSGGVAHGTGPEFKPQYGKKKKKERKKPVRITLRTVFHILKPQKLEDISDILNNKLILIRYMKQRALTENKKFLCTFNNNNMQNHYPHLK